MEELPDNILKLFRNAGWFEARAVSLEKRLPDGFGSYPTEYINLMSRFWGLTVENRGKFKFKIFSKVHKGEFSNRIIFNPMFAEGLNTIDHGEELDYMYYSSIIGRQLYPVGITHEEWHIALDESLTLYIFHIGYGCLKLHDNPFEGFRCILENDMYTTVYELCEHENNFGEWFKRPQV